ncbi:MAG: hypothetical protein IAE80_00460, partial [Anaerolinea sp.]|nr:hypothetical protein [Anaerolinea sp.]
SSVWVSTVPNLEAWLEAVGDGTVDPLNDPDNRQQMATVPVSVWRWDDTDPPMLVREGLSQFTLRPNGAS